MQRHRIYSLVMVAVPLILSLKITGVKCWATFVRSKPAGCVMTQDVKGRQETGLRKYDILCVSSSFIRFLSAAGPYRRWLRF